MNPSPKCDPNDAHPFVKGRALIVDDDPIMTTILSLMLEREFEVTAVDSGEECIAAIADVRPDIVLLDIAMSGIDGYQTATELRWREASRYLPIIFVSSQDGLEDRLHAYEAGGDDFIIKPFDPEELLQKVRRVCRLKTERDLLLAERCEMQRMALNMMDELGDIGNLMSFMRDSLPLTDYRDLAQKILDTTTRHGFSASVQIRHPIGIVTLTPHGPASPLEESVFEKVVSRGRMFEYRSRLIVNFKAISLMLSNMPVSDVAACGRILDNAAMLAEIADTIAEIIALRQETQYHAEIMRSTLLDAQAAFGYLQTHYQQQQRQAQRQVQQTIADVERLGVEFELSAAQHAALSATLNAAQTTIVATWRQQEQLEQKFEKIVKHIEKQSVSLLD